MTCQGNLGPTALTGPAPDVNGGPAYWTNVHGLVWEYGRDAWAWLTLYTGSRSTTLSPASEALERTIAARVRYDYGPVHYGFTITGLPASWQTRRNSTENIATIDGVLANVGYQVGPASNPTALTINLEPASSSVSVCGSGPGNTGHVIFDGAEADLVTVSNHGHASQQILCASDVDGLHVQILLDLSTQGRVPRHCQGTVRSGIWSRSCATCTC